VPTSTWKPWKAGRHEEGRAVDIAGEGERGGGCYSNACTQVKVAPRQEDGEGIKPVYFRALAVVLQQRVDAPRSPWCPRVSSNRRIQHAAGCQGSKVSMPLGGQTPPNSAVGGVACTGSAGEQRRVEGTPKEPGDEETSTSEGDEQDHAVRRWGLICTTRVCDRPCYCASRITSVHQLAMV